MNPQKTDTGRYAYDENGFRFVVSHYRRRDIYEGPRNTLWRYDFTDGAYQSGFATKGKAVDAARERIDDIMRRVK